MFLVGLGGIFFGAGKICLMRFLLCREISLLRIARGFLRLRFGNLLGERGGFVFAQVLSREVILDWRGVMRLLEMVRGWSFRHWFRVHHHMRIARLSRSRLALEVMLDRRDSSLRVLLDWMFASLPLRE